MKKHSIAKSLAVYEKILKNAWRITWRQKELWIFGLLAGIAYSGSILKRVLDGAIQVTKTEQLSLETIRDSINGAPYILSYARSVMELPIERLIITLIAVFISFAIAAYILTLSQHILLVAIHRSASKKKPLSLREVFAGKKHRHLLRLFSIDALVAIASIIVIAGSSIPLSVLLSDSFFMNFLVYLAVYSVILPILFVINALGMFTMIHAVRRDDGIDKAFSRAILVVSRHWLAASEMAIVLFLINIAAYFVFVPLVFLLTLLTAPFFLAAVASGSIILMTFVGFAAFLVGAVIALCYFGAITVFNYATWTELVERVERFPHLPVLEGVVKKLHA